MTLGEFSIINKTKGKLPSLPFAIIKDDILGKGYSLSIAIIGEAASRKINNQYRGKDKPTNVLSFPLSKTAGEILLCPNVIKKEASNFEKNFTQFLGFLVIHGMLHLKGMDHSEKMEKLEKKYEKKYLSRTKFLIK